MIKFWAICQNTFTQTIRQPIYGVLIFATFVVLLMNLTLAGWTMSVEYHQSDQRMLESLSLSTLLVAGLLVAAFSASSVLAREIEDKTALTVISKPVSRATFLFGKFAGVAGAVAVAYYLCSLVFLMTVRHKVMPAVTDPYDIPVITLGVGSFLMAILIAIGGNLLFGWSFVSSAVCASLILMTVAMGLISFIGKGWTIVPFGEDIRPDLISGIALLFLAVMVLTAVAVTVSTRLGQVLTLLVCSVFFLVGSAHPAIFGRWNEIPVARILGWAVGKLVYFYPLDALTMDRPIPWEYLGWAALYAACYIFAVLALGVVLFQRRPIEADSGSAAMPGAVSLLAYAGRGVAVVSGIVGLVLLSLPKFYDTAGFLSAGGFLVLGVLLWMLWGYFGRGAKWSYWVVLTLTAIPLVRSLLLLTGPDLMKFLFLGDEDPAHLLLQAGVAAFVLLVLVLPKTRRHFQSQDD